ncbi:MAG: hypothetical protein PHC53_01075 [Patescibacteria group bacterium]|nr:hypothetical protein [Patescibacteria group bacterium]
MPKKYYWFLGLAIVVIAVGATLFYWNYGYRAKSGLKEKAGKAGSASCETAQYPFACYLDKAMAAKDLNLCNDVGMAKRVDCLNAYAEILNVALDCNSIKDIDFKNSCLAAVATPK